MPGIGTEKLVQQNIYFLLFPCVLLLRSSSCTVRLKMEAKIMILSSNCINMVSYIQYGNLVWMYLGLDEKRHAFYYWDSSHCENELREIHSFWNCQPQKSLSTKIFAVNVWNPCCIYVNIKGFLIVIELI